MRHFNTILTFFNKKKSKVVKGKEKIIPILPTECMQRIFQYIQNDSTAKLYPSLLVNRYWSKNVVSFLWNRPFRSCSKHNRYKLINTLLMFFSLEETNLINSKLKAYNIIIPSQPNPLFNYSAMIHEIYYMGLEIFVSSYLKKITCLGSNELHRKVQILFITGSLFQMFLRQSPNLKTLVIDKEIYTMNLPNISIFTESNSNLTNLTKLRINYDSKKILNTIQFLNYISKLCHNIHILEFKFNMNSYNVELLQSISNTVIAQKGLKEFSLSNVVHIGIESIMMSLLTHINSLTSISLAFLQLDQTTLDILLNLNQLKELRLCFCSCENLDNYTFIHSFNLYTLHLVELKEQITLTILQSSGNSIKQLGLNIKHIEILEIALNYCPNLEEIILYYLSNENQNEKVVKRIIKSLEKSWREKLSLISFKEISTKPLIYY
ncbi:hypothetical protein C1645_869941 [Glomus cerebriforme]|uniref:F-box/LRR-repeat protein 15/At3g58940/PEG3-like LRR domain-containing protein n=1 Tax=Glomus cerebriforme TaxID=658196 RepID=A0A397TNN1_9GLOM|nr:hypothetical protein C1645_869941 [Glomus cerebriforme]